MRGSRGSCLWLGNTTYTDPSSKARQCVALRPENAQADRRRRESRAERIPAHGSRWFRSSRRYSVEMRWQLDFRQDRPDSGTLHLEWKLVNFVFITYL